MEYAHAVVYTATMRYLLERGMAMEIWLIERGMFSPGNRFIWYK
jgi:hypothetical protein